MAALTIDRSTLPILTVEIDGEQTETDMESYCRAVEELLDKREKYAVVHLVRSYSPTLSHAKQVAHWALANRDRIAEYCLGGACVVKSSVFRLFLSSFTLITPFPCPVQLVETKEEAHQWVRERFAEAGAPLARE